MATQPDNPLSPDISPGNIIPPGGAAPLVLSDVIPPPPPSSPPNPPDASQIDPLQDIPVEAVAAGAVGYDDALGAIPAQPVDPPVELPLSTQKALHVLAKNVQHTLKGTKGALKTVTALHKKAGTQITKSISKKQKVGPPPKALVSWDSTDVTLDHKSGDNTPPLSAKCLQTLATAVKLLPNRIHKTVPSWKANVNCSWKWSDEEPLQPEAGPGPAGSAVPIPAAAEAADAGSGPPEKRGNKNTEKGAETGMYQPSKIDQETYQGLLRLADRLGYVFSKRAGDKKFQPNANALLAALGNGDAFKEGSVLHESIAACKNSVDSQDTGNAGESKQMLH